MSLMHGQTNDHVVARREVSAEDMSKQVENRHFIHDSSGDFFPPRTIERKSSFIRHIFTNHLIYSISKM